jgi:beta-glucosidase
LKFQLGLFENPYVDPGYAVSVSNTREHQELALKTAREGIVLLKNEKNLLPLKKNIGSIAVIGPNANHERNMLGDYIADNVTQDVVTVLEGIKNKVASNTKVTYVQGCNVIGKELNEILKAQEAARKAEVAIVVVGENERMGYQGTNGEGCDVSSLDLTGLQEELIRAVYETGTPTIVVLINGRPLSIQWTAENVPAILEAWLPGEKGGEAVADVLFGDCNPCGRLPITIPRSVGQLPFYYNYSPSKAHRMNQGYVDLILTPLFEFGYGLSYTSFKYENLVITPKESGTEGEFRISLEVGNTGNRSGAEVVQLYINDVISSVTVPVKELKGFEKVTLDPGEKKRIEFILTPEHLAFFNSSLKEVVEPGTFKVMVGSSSEDIRLTGKFEVVE